MSRKNVAVIGGGPGGYVAAIRLAQLGAEVTLVEKDVLGGTCLNRGCIPTKVLLHTAELYETAKSAKHLGFEADNCRVDWGQLMKRKQTVVGRLTGGVGALMKRHNIAVLPGTARFISPNELAVTPASGPEKRLKADIFVIAAGSEPAMPPVPGFDLAGIATSTEALAFEHLPKSLAVVGGGVIGIELASVYASLGTKVTVIEALPSILANVDEEFIPIILARLKKLGVTIHIKTAVSKITATKEGYALSAKGDAAVEIVAEKVLVCTGRRPAVDGLGLDKAGVAVEKRRILVDGQMRTNVPHIYAIGDCASPIMLAHAASHQGLAAAAAIMGQDGHGGDAMAAPVPGAIYTHPEIAWVGLTEKEARAKGLAIKVGRFPLAANGKSLIMDGTDGMIKIIAGADYGEILGVHIIGPRATDLIAEAGLALTLEAIVDDIAATIHAHPTVAEAMAEAAMAVRGQAIHSF